MGTFEATPADGRASPSFSSASYASPVTLAQSAAKSSRPRSVSGWRTHFWSAPKGTVVKVIANPPLRLGSKITLQVSDGTGGAANQDNQNEEDLNKLQNDINSIAEELKKLFGGG